ncbi:hypothetical protein V6Z11_D03G106700, partial [Gossypium hirsutum]
RDIYYLLDGFLSYFAEEFARFFELLIPCLLCTRIDKTLSRNNAEIYYNDSICNHHKKNVSPFSFCHCRKKLSNIRSMCESYLLSFATEKESDCDTYKSLLGILHKDIELFVDEDHEFHLSLPSGKREEGIVFEKSNDLLCSCCGAPLKVKPLYSKGKVSPPSFVAPIPSPKPPTNQNLDFSHVKYTDCKLNWDESEAAQDDNDRSKGFTNEKPLEEDGNGDDEDKTPTFIKGNRFFGISFADSSSTSPRWTKISRKLLQEKAEFVSEYGVGQVPTEAEGDILLHLKRQKRNASAVAAYNAMAMITRLQADEAAVQMEALQYQRMMEEQAKYDQEILQEMNYLLVKREEEIKELEDELEIYRHNYGCLKAADFEGQGGDGSDEGFQVLTPPSYSSTNGECTSPTARKLNEWRAECTSPTARSDALEKAQNHSQSDSMADDGGGEAIKRPMKVSKGSRQLSRLKNLHKKPHISSVGGRLTSRSSSDEEETGNMPKKALNGRQIARKKSKRI